MLAFKRISKAISHVMFPRKKITARKIKGVEVNPPVNPREEIQILETQVRERLIDFLDSLENYAENDCDETEDADYDRVYRAACALGFPEVEELYTDHAMKLVALAAAAACHGLYHSDLDTADTFDAINNLAHAIRKIDCDDYTFFDGVDDDCSLGDRLYEELEDCMPSKLRFLLGYVNLEEWAADVRRNEDGIFTPQGYFQYGTLEF